MKNIIHYLLLWMLIVPSVVLSAQEQTLFTQYMFNGITINPAYSGTDPAAVLTLADREQWLGLNGAPQSTTLSFYSPIGMSNLSLGTVLAYDRLGANQNINGNISAAYQWRLNQSIYMSLGLSIGVLHGQANLASLRPSDDPFFSANKYNTYGNIGLGGFIYSDRWYIGLSSPQFQGFVIHNAEQELAEESYRKQYYLTAGYLFSLNRSLDFKPNVLVGYSYGHPVTDLNANFCIKKVLWAGLSYRLNESVSGVLQYSVTPQIQIAYSYDYGTTEIQKTSSMGSHEFMIRYRFIKTDDQVKPTRWF